MGCFIQESRFIFFIFSCSRFMFLYCYDHIVDEWWRFHLHELKKKSISNRGHSGSKLYFLTYLLLFWWVWNINGKVARYFNYERWRSRTSGFKGITTDLINLTKTVRTCSKANIQTTEKGCQGPLSRFAGFNYWVTRHFVVLPYRTCCLTNWSCST